MGWLAGLSIGRLGHVQTREADEVPRYGRRYSTAGPEVLPQIQVQADELMAGDAKLAGCQSLRCVALRCFALRLGLSWDCSLSLSLSTYMYGMDRIPARLEEAWEAITSQTLGVKKQQHRDAWVH